MKKSILTFGAVIASAACVMAQGTLNYSSRVTGAGGVLAPTYGAAPGEPGKIGNTASGVPAGTQTYVGGLLTGSGFSAQLFYAAGLDQAEASLVAAPLSLTTFRTSATLAGTLATSFQTLPGTTVGGSATLQLRAWDNQNGTLTTWDQAFAAWQIGNTRAGMSPVFNISGLVDNQNPNPPVMEGLRSFNIYIVPEPSTFLLAGLGAAALLIFRRRK
jgi:hypothetical protein